MQVQQFYDYTDMLKANLQSAITIGGKLQFKDDKQYQEFLDAGLIIGSLLVNSESANVYNTSDNTIWNAVEAKVTLWGGDPVNDMNLRHLALVEVLEPLSAPDDILVQIEKVRVVAKFDVVDETKIQFGDKVYVEADPFTKNIKPGWWDSGVNIMTFYLSPDGNDNNDGFTWDTPLYSVKEVNNRIPKDLNGTMVYIVFLPGEYIYNEQQTIKAENGKIHLIKAMLDWNTADTPLAIHMRAGKENPIPSQEKTYFKCGTEFPQGYSLFRFEGSIGVEFGAHNYDKAWNEEGFCFYDNIVLVGSETVGHENRTLIFAECKEFYTHCGFTFDMKLTQKAGFESYELEKGFFKGSRFIGGSGTASTSTGGDKGAIVLEVDSKMAFVIDDAPFGFGTGYAPQSGKNFELVNIAQFFATGWMGGMDGCRVTLHSGSLDYDGSGISRTKPRIVRGGDNNQAKIEYDPDVVDFVDSSKSLRTTNILNSVGTIISTSIIFNDQIKAKDNTFITKLLTTVPSDDTLGNQDIAFYMDEATDTLKVKYKDSGGVVQTGDIAILT